MEESSGAWPQFGDGAQRGGGDSSSSSDSQMTDTRGALRAGEAKGVAGDTDLEEEGDVRAWQHVWRHAAQDRSCSTATSGNQSWRRSQGKKVTEKQ
jgi:hypothetical protein